MSIPTITKYIDGLNAALLATDKKAISQVAETIWKAYLNDKQIFIFGNGGSASTASHMACDLGKGVNQAGKRRLRVLSLCDNVAIMTAWANDVNYDSVFTEQLKNSLNPEDIVIAISASGNSPNVVQAVEFAKKQGAVVIGMTGFLGGKLKALSDISIHYDLNDYGQVEDLHLMAEHIITQCIREKMINV